MLRDSGYHRVSDDGAECATHQRPDEPRSFMRRRPFGDQGMTSREYHAAREANGYSGNQQDGPV